jgi:hypothetical protein
VRRHEGGTIIYVIAGTPFRLTFSVANFTYGTPDQSFAQVSGLFSFANVPAGAAIVSCNGYVSDRAVPVRATTWGQLKTLYR